MHPNLKKSGMAWLFAISLGLGGFATASAFADFASAPITGAAIVTHGKFTNIYLFTPSHLGETWDQHLLAMHTAGDPFDTETSEAIDAFVQQLTVSSYFDALTQYGTGGALFPQVINPPEFFGRAPTMPACVKAAMKDATSGKTLQYGTLRSFAACEQSSDGVPTDQVNIIVSPELNVAEFTFGPDSASPVCTPGNTVTGFHGWGFGVPNFTVIPLNLNCNSSLASVTQTISHEMVETVSDPAGFGYIHETSFLRFVGDDNAEFNNDELGDICQPNGPKDPDGSVAFLPFGSGLSVSRYWSNVDNDCEPHFIMNRTWANQSGNPIIRFTGDVHDLLVVPSIARGDRRLLIQQLQLLVTTGDDDLRGGNSPGDNADAIVTLSSGPPITIHNINAGRHWNNNELHSANLFLPAGITAGEITGLHLHTQFGGGWNGDNWNVNRIVLLAALTAGTPPPPDTVTTISITVRTGNDNARSDTELVGSISGQQPFCLKPSNNADPDSTCANGGSATDQNGHQAWENWTTSAQQFRLSAPVTVSALAANPISIQLKEHNNGFESDDNWDIQAITITATTLGGATTSLLSLSSPVNPNNKDNCVARLKGSPNATTVDFTLDGANGHTYADGTSSERGATTTCKNNGD